MDSSSSSTPFPHPDTPIFTLREAALYWNVSVPMADAIARTHKLGKVVRGHKPRRCRRLSINEVQSIPPRICHPLRWGILEVEDRDRKAYADAIDALWPDLV